MLIRILQIAALAVIEHYIQKHMARHIEDSAKKSGKSTKTAKRIAEK